MNKSVFVVFLSLLLVFKATFLLAQNNEANDNKKGVIIFKLPYHLINYDFRYKRIISYFLENEISVSKKISLNIIFGILPETENGYWITNDSKSFGLYNSVDKGYALSFSLGIRKYLSGKFSDLQGFYLSSCIGNVFANYSKYDGTSYKINIQNMYLLFGWQRSYKKFNFDLTPVKIGLIYNGNKNYGNTWWFDYYPSISIGLKF